MSWAAAVAATTTLAATSAMAADAELGRYLATECVMCHRAAAGEAIPNIFGMAEANLVAALKAYRGRSRPNPVMQNIAGRLTDEDIAALAHHFARASKP